MVSLRTCSPKTANVFAGYSITHIPHPLMSTPRPATRLVTAWRVICLPREAVLSSKERQCDDGFSGDEQSAEDCHHSHTSRRPVFAYWRGSLLSWAPACTCDCITYTGTFANLRSFCPLCLGGSFRGNVDIFSKPYLAHPFSHSPGCSPYSFMLLWMRTKGVRLKCGVTISDSWASCSFACL